MLRLGFLGMRPLRLLVLAVLVVGAGVLVLPQAGNSAGCSFSAHDCALLDNARDAANGFLDAVNDEEEKASAAEARADSLTKRGSTLAARAAWRDAVRARLAGRDVLKAYLVTTKQLIGFFGDYGSLFDDPAAKALHREQFRALAGYLEKDVQLWDWWIAQALRRVNKPQPAVVNAAKEQAVARAGAAAHASAAAVAAAVGPGRHPWPPVTDDAGLRDLWAELGTENAALSAGFDRLVKGLTGSLSVAERKTRADAMAVLLGQYRDTWKVMLNRLNGAKGLTSYAGCRSKMIDHAKGLRARDRLIVRLISAVRKGDVAGIRRALAAQRAQGAKNRQLAAKVRACLKAAGPPAAAPGPKPPAPPTFGTVSELLCPATIRRNKRELTRIPPSAVPSGATTGPKGTTGYNCAYAENPNAEPNKRGATKQLSFKYFRALRPKPFCMDLAPVYQPDVLYSTTYDISVYVPGDVDDAGNVRRKLLKTLEGANIAVRC